MKPTGISGGARGFGPRHGRGSFGYAPPAAPAKFDADVPDSIASARLANSGTQHRIGSTDAERAGTAGNGYIPGYGRPSSQQDRAGGLANWDAIFHPGAGEAAPFRGSTPEEIAQFKAGSVIQTPPPPAPTVAPVQTPTGAVATTPPPSPYGTGNVRITQPGEYVPPPQPIMQGGAQIGINHSTPPFSPAAIAAENAGSSLPGLPAVTPQQQPKKPLVAKNKNDMNWDASSEESD